MIVGSIRTISVSSAMPSVLTTCPVTDRLRGAGLAGDEAAVSSAATADVDALEAVPAASRALSGRATSRIIGLPADNDSMRIRCTSLTTVRAAPGGAKPGPGCPLALRRKHGATIPCASAAEPSRTA